MVLDWLLRRHSYRRRAVEVSEGEVHAVGQIGGLRPARQVIHHDALAAGGAAGGQLAFTAVLRAVSLVVRRAAEVFEQPPGVWVVDSVDHLKEVLLVVGVLPRNVIEVAHIMDQGSVVRMQVVR